MFNNEDKFCPFCQDTLEDEFHFLLECETYAELRKKYIEKYIKYMKDMRLTMTFLIDGKGFIKTKNVAMFIYYGLKYRQQCFENIMSPTLCPHPSSTTPTSPELVNLQRL